MKITEYDGRTYFKGWAGLDLFFGSKRAKGEAKGSVIMVHGYSEYAERYSRVIEELVASGYDVFYFDQRGHGRSEGVRADVVRFADYVRDLGTFIEYVRENSGGGKVFVIAHSTGAAAAVALAGAQPDVIDGLVTTGIYIWDAEGYEPWKVTMAKILVHFAPLIQVQEVSPARVAEDPEIQRQYKTDPLIYHGAVRIRMGTHFIKMESYLSEAIGAISIPLYIYHGGTDRLASVEGSKKLHESAASSDKTLSIVDGVGHEVLHDYGWEERCREIADWLDARN